MQRWRDALAAARLLFQYGELPRDGQRDVVDFFSKNAGHRLDATFRSERLRAVLGWDSVVGDYASPYVADSAYALLHHCFGEVNGKAGEWRHRIAGLHHRGSSAHPGGGFTGAPALTAAAGSVRDLT